MLLLLLLSNQFSKMETMSLCTVKWQSTVSRLIACSFIYTRIWLFLLLLKFQNLVTPFASSVSQSGYSCCFLHPRICFMCLRSWLLLLFPLLQNVVTPTVLQVLKPVTYISSCHRSLSLLPLSQKLNNTHCFFFSSITQRLPNWSPLLFWLQQ